ncbi:hypothetical protein AURDEDRAFT_125915 [Auricularia subglabra TFB-10046 SS5]|nr:hypothetical protein AURDEDRAFT_125915 [Auricularia subglabra TFB-10046 SS5]
MSQQLLTLDALNLVLDRIDLDALLICSQVCAHWRIASRNHPLFWKRLVFDQFDGETDGKVAFFMDRLTARIEPDATISLSLRIASPSTAFTNVILPAIQLHIHRAEEIAFVVVPASAPSLWPLFRLDAPHLHSLEVVCHCLEVYRNPIPGLFNAHIHHLLRRVHLRDVLLPDHVTPMPYALDRLTAAYSNDDTCMDGVLSWFPQAGFMDVANERVSPGRVRRGPQNRSLAVPNLSASHFQSLKHLVVRDGAWFSKLQDRNIPQITICNFKYRPDAGVKLTIPPARFQCARFRRVFTRTWSASSRSGEVMLSSSDGNLMRYYQHLSHKCINSTIFLTDFVRPELLVILATPLTLGFPSLCRNACELPLLKTLRIALNSLPAADPGWNCGSILCPFLQRLVLQREIPVHEAVITPEELTSFLNAAIVRTTSADLAIILEGVCMDVSSTSDNITRNVICRPPSFDWSFERDPRREKRVNAMAANPGRMGNDWIVMI